MNKDVRKLTDVEFDRLIEMLRSGKTRYEIMKELRLPYHFRDLIPDRWLENYERACKSGRARRYRRKKAAERAMVHFSCHVCGAQYLVRVRRERGGYELELVECKDKFGRIPLA